MEQAARSTIARLSEAPSNYHQACVFFAVVEPERGVRMVALSCLIVLLQVATVVSIFTGADIKACGQQDQCRAGTFCGRQSFMFGDSAVGTNRCFYCGSSQTDR